MSRPSLGVDWACPVCQERYQDMSYVTQIDDFAHVFRIAHMGWCDTCKKFYLAQNEQHSFEEVKRESL